ncbi:Outer membrane protein W [Rickettsiales bacterium Ac37b]|nr:Outer membrane protein W [Rickettsiales bacterium Ac37b]
MNKLLTGCAISTVLLTLGSGVSAQEITREGNILTKLGVQGIFPTTHSKYTVENHPVFKNKFKNSAGVELSAGYFFTDNFAADLSVGYTEYKLKNNSFKDALIMEALGEVPANFNSSIKTKAFPVTLMLQYHTPTYGAFQPYVGAGYSYNFFKNKHTYTYEDIFMKATFRVKPKNVGTPVIQVGSNFDLGQNLGVNFDVKYSWLRPKYKLSSETTTLLRSISEYKTYKAKMNPVVVTLGLTYKF